jgi:hypothetical protein
MMANIHPISVFVLLSRVLGDRNRGRSPGMRCEVV